MSVRDYREWVDRGVLLQGSHQHTVTVDSIRAPPTMGGAHADHNVIPSAVYFDTIWVTNNGNYTQDIRIDGYESGYLPETEGVAFLDVVLGAGGDGQMMALIGLHTNRQEQKAPREALPSTPTGVALASAPLKIERNASIKSLRAGLRPIDGRSRLSNRTEQALSERSLSSSNVAPALDMGLDEYAVSLFETQGLPTHSDDPEIRRIWRLIANARTPDDMAQAQMALGDYHSKMGNQALAEISYRRAQYWKGRGR